MDTLWVINKLADSIKAKGINTTTDPYFHFGEYLKRNPPEPVVIVESGDDTDIFVSGGGSMPYKADYHIAITCMVYADQKRPREEYKPEALALSKSVFDAVVKAELKIKSAKQRDGEFTVDGAKVSAVTLDIIIDAPYKII